MITGREKPRGFNRIGRACVYSWKGLKAAWTEERAFREEVALCALVIPAAFHFGRTALERVALIAPMFLVLIVELLNSAIEAIVDRDSLDRDKLAAMAKDMGSAAVLISLALLTTVWVVILTCR
jgi:diacylglycerol kinase (ATP)